MSIPTTFLVNAAIQEYDKDTPGISDETRCRLEWAWGLRYGGLDEHLRGYSDSAFTETLIDENLVLVPNPETIRKFLCETLNAALTLAKPHTMILELYEGSKYFEYLVFPVGHSSNTPPRILVSDVPPHLTVGPSVAKMLRCSEYNPSTFATLRDSLVVLIGRSPPSGASFTLRTDDFTNLKYIYDSWSSCLVPPRFLGLEDPDETVLEELMRRADESPVDAESSTMESELDSVSTYEEPCRRLLPHELEDNHFVKIRQSPSVEDDGISFDSHITGVDDPNEYAKASVERGDYKMNRRWLKGMTKWVQTASGVVDDKMLLNDGQIEEDCSEQPRVATSLDLDKPDYLARPHKTRRAAR
ncbi:hypothetical protein B0H11DRAFT_2295014 [Mycena galericulata]|nr:hypothetical protein B0H11DRAFT_2295014 [Mycena galericulata]